MRAGAELLAQEANHGIDDVAARHPLLPIVEQAQPVKLVEHEHCRRRAALELSGRLQIAAHGHAETPLEHLRRSGVARSVSVRLLPLVEGLSQQTRGLPAAGRVIEPEAAAERRSDAGRALSGQRREVAGR